jgi:hypothetical protein
MKHGPLDPPAIVRVNIDLAQLERDIRSAYEAAKGAQWDAVEGWFRLGGLLAEVREALPHGNKKGSDGQRLGGFSSWIAKRNLPFGVRQAEKYLRLHDQERYLRVMINAHWNSGFPSGLTIDELLRFVSEPCSEEPERLPEGQVEASLPTAESAEYEAGPPTVPSAENEAPGEQPPDGPNLEPILRVHARMQNEGQERWPRLARDVEAMVERARALQLSGYGPADSEDRTRVIEQLRSLDAQLQAVIQGLESANRPGRPRRSR